MEFRDYWDAVVRGWWLIAIFGLVGLVVPLLLASAAPSKGHIETHYQTTSVIGSPPTAANGGASLLGGGITIGQILYYASTDDVIAQTTTNAGLNEPAPAVRAQISVVAPGGDSGQSGAQSGVVNVTTTGATPAAALGLNRAFVDAMQTVTNNDAVNSVDGSEQNTEKTLARVMNDIATKNFLPGLTAQALDVQVSALQSYLASLVVQEPGSGLQVPQAPTASSTTAIVTGTPTVVDNRALRVAVGLVIGLVLGALAALAMWLLDGRLKTAKRARAALGYPVVAEIPFEASDSTEEYRMLWLQVFREPLPLPPMEHQDRLYEGEDPVLDSGLGVGVRSGPAERP